MNITNIVDLLAMLTVLNIAVFIVCAILYGLSKN